jgi:hypothetical protein
MRSGRLMLQANLRSTEARVTRLKQTLAQTDEENLCQCILLIYSGTFD